MMDSTKKFACAVVVATALLGAAATSGSAADLLANQSTSSAATSAAAAPSAPAETTAALWAPYLETLTIAPVTKGLASPYAFSASEDLPSLYAKELGEIRGAWAAERKMMTGATPKALREAENGFFHARVQALNETTFQTLEHAAQSHRSSKKDYRALAETILAKVAKNPVANLESAQAYDQGGQVGYCFGRALLVHLFLLQAGVPQDDIVKVFNLGELMVQKQLWRFHVAVMVRDSQHGFLVIDPLQDKPLPYREWVAINAAYDIKGRFSRARFYAADPRKFLPAFGGYDVKQLEDPVLKRYFDDLARSLGS